MKNNSTSLLLTLIVFAMTGTAGVAAAPGAANPGLPGQVQRNSADIADNFSQIQENRADIFDLDERVSALESGGGSPGGERSFVDVDCTANGDANALLTGQGASMYFPPNTTYNIHGACNGPLFVTEDGVRFVGVDGTEPEIVLPGDAPNPGDGAIFVDGANDVRVQNLVVNASAWGSGAIAEGTDAAGIYVRNSFVRVINTRIVGGLWSINPFRNGIVRTQGLVQLEGFVNAGLSIGDQSLVTGRGPVVIGSNVSDGSYLVAIEAYRGGAADMRFGLVTNLPAPDPDIGFFPSAIEVTDSSQVRLRNGGNVDLDGGVFVSGSSLFRMDAGSVSGPITGRRNGTLSLRDVQHDLGAISIAQNTSLNTNNSSLGALFASSNSSVEVFGGELGGLNLDQGAVAQIGGASIVGDLVLFSATSLNLFQTGPGVGSLNGNTVYSCGLYVVAEVGFDIGMTGNQVIGCPPF